MPRPKRMNGEGSVRKRPDGRYEARALLQDGRRISVYGGRPGRSAGGNAGDRRGVRRERLAHDVSYARPGRSGSTAFPTSPTDSLVHAAFGQCSALRTLPPSSHSFSVSESWSDSST